jgi:hypothetical protein
MTTTSLHEGLDWVYDLDGLYFIFYIVERDGKTSLAYKMFKDAECTEYVSTTVWVGWGDYAIKLLESYSHSKLRPIIPFCGPVQPHPSAVILKIRAMEKRRKQYA